MAEREFSTVGHERVNNPRLQMTDREAFIQFKVSENHYQPPYFRLMERLNMEGGDAPPPVMRPCHLSLKQLQSCTADHLIDIREPMAYAAGHFPRSMSLPVGMISAFAGWFIREGESMVLIASDEEQLATAIEGSRHIYVGQLNERWHELDKNHHYTLMCASGARATVAAGWLVSRGFDNIDIYLGSMGAWKAGHD
ncbi:rhodanese-like domain-containing protein [Psychrobacter sp. DWR1-2-3]